MALLGKGIIYMTTEKREDRESPRQADAEIEVTPEMVERGVKAFYDYDDRPRYPDFTLRELVSAIVYGALGKSRVAASPIMGRMVRAPPDLRKGKSKATPSDDSFAQAINSVSPSLLSLSEWIEADLLLRLPRMRKDRA